MRDLEPLSSATISTAAPQKSTPPPKVWVTELASPTSKTISDEPSTEPEKDDDWRTFFDTPVVDASTTAPAAKGQRVYKLSISKSVLSTAAHNAQMSATWLAMVPQLMISKDLSSRALTVLHGVVAGPGSGEGGEGAKRFRDPIKLMDWIAGCVDHGTLCSSRLRSRSGLH